MSNPLAALFQDSRPVVTSPAAAPPLKRSRGRSSGLSTRFSMERLPEPPPDLSTLTTEQLFELAGGYRFKEAE